MCVFVGTSAKYHLLCDHRTAIKLYCELIAIMAYVTLSTHIDNEVQCMLQFKFWRLEFESQLENWILTFESLKAYPKNWNKTTPF